MTCSAFVICAVVFGVVYGFGALFKAIAAQFGAGRQVRGQADSIVGGDRPSGSLKTPERSPAKIRFRALIEVKKELDLTWNVTTPYH